MAIHARLQRRLSIRGKCKWLISASISRVSSRRIRSGLLRHRHPTPECRCTVRLKPAGAARYGRRSAPPVLNVSNRYGALHYGDNKMVAINNVELISDRPLDVNLREIADVKRAWPDRAVIVSAMVESNREAWRDIIRRIEDTGADGIELNYGCPHGMSERGMGSAVGQVPEYCEQITSWVMEVARVPVIVKLTPNVTNIVPPARAAVAAGANALSLINTLNSIIGVDLDSFEITPSIGGKGGHGGYAGPAVKPIALNMLSALGTDDVVRRSECRFRAWAAYRPGGMQRSFCCWGPAACRSAQR